LRRDTATSESLALRLKSLGAETDDLDVVLQALKRCVSVAAGADIKRAGDSLKHSTVLLAGMACSYERSEDGGRRIHSFHHPGDICDLHRYVFQERESAVAIQALTDAVVAVIEHRDVDALLAARPKLALAT
jgi:CRP-like cAMP-binding protein